MFDREAQWLRGAIARYSDDELSPLIDLGSSDANYRQSTQPWIDAKVFAPLRKREVPVYHSDIRNGRGVDLRVDLLDDVGMAELRDLHARSILCCNLLEHVVERAEFARRCVEILAPGGLLFFTGPYSYPFHRDPIDTMWRPTPADVVALFPNTTFIDGTILDTGMSYRDDVRRRPWIIHRQILHAPFPFIQTEQWKRSMKKIYWLFNNYKVTCMVLKKKTVQPNKVSRVDMSCKAFA